jgi:carbon-monoxide dehydrogenase large subunit
VLYEHAAYSDEGQFLADTFLDYALPTATTVPTVDIDHLHTSSMGEVGFHGMAEGSALCAPAAITNAIADALAPLGVKITEQFLPAWRILELIRSVALEKTLTG